MGRMIAQGKDKWPGHSGIQTAGATNSKIFLNMMIKIDNGSLCVLLGSISISWAYIYILLILEKKMCSHEIESLKYCSKNSEQ